MPPCIDKKIAQDSKISIDMAQHILMGGCPHCSVMADEIEYMHDMDCPHRKYWEKLHIHKIGESWANNGAS